MRVGRPRPFPLFVVPVLSFPLRLNLKQFLESLAEVECAHCQDDPDTATQPRGNPRLGAAVGPGPGPRYQVL